MCRYQDCCCCQQILGLMRVVGKHMYTCCLWEIWMLAGGCIIVVVFFYCIGCSGSVFVLGFAGDQFCSSEGEDVCGLRPQDEARDALCCSWSCKFSFYHKQLRSAYETCLLNICIYTINWRRLHQYTLHHGNKARNLI